MNDLATFIAPQLPTGRDLERSELVELATAIGLAVLRGGTNGNYGWVEVSASATGYATAASWITLVLAGVWRPRAHWLDRLGRFLGVLWIGMGLTGIVLTVLESW